jgi:signal transduction histidine kinase/ActR/RegA family two-component response regulator
MAKRGTRKRQQSRSRPRPDFRKLFESAPGLYLVLAPDLSIVAVSDAYLRATMTERNTICGRGLFEIFPHDPDHPEATGVANLLASLGRVLSERRPDAMAVQQYAIRRPEAEGGGFEERHWSPLNTPVFGDDGAIAYIIHRVEDVTEFMRLKQKGSEQDRSAEELRTRAGMMEAEIYRRAQQIQETNAQLRELQADLEGRVEARTADLQLSNEALQRSETQLRQAQKLEAIGQLAGGVAHDFNNLLTAIMGYGQLLMNRVDPGSTARRDVDEILRAADRAAALTRQLLAFSRRQVLEPKVLDLNAAITETDKMLRRLIGEDIDLVTVPSPKLGRVKVDPGQIVQVLMNLVVNARDAMPEGGKLTIETANVELGAEYVRERPDVKAGPYVMLAVSDTGIGMSRETAARVFEPFFTTKEPGKGTGLGLSTVHGIVKQSGGHVELYSEPGEGTTFKIYLPRVEDLVELETTSPAPVGRSEGNEVLLLVEDEDSIRRAMRESLELLGYLVLEAKDGSQAITYCERRGQPIDLIITDVVMPLMSGPEMVQRVIAVRPELRALFVSGYADHALVHRGLRTARSAFLQKPFTPERLARKVRELLDEPQRKAA